MKKLLLIALILTLSACGATGQINLSQPNKPISKNNARIVVTRDNSLMYMAAAADLHVNGSKIASLGRGGSVVYDIPKGRNTLNVTTLGSFGQYIITFDAAPKNTYEFTISPQSSAMLPSVAFGTIGDAVNANNNDQSGYFQITQGKK